MSKSKKVVGPRNIEDLGLKRGDMLFDFVFQVGGGVITKKYMVSDFIFVNEATVIDCSTQEIVELHFSYIFERCARTKLEAVKKQIKIMEERIKEAKKWENYFANSEATPGNEY